MASEKTIAEQEVKVSNVENSIREHKEPVTNSTLQTRKQNVVARGQGNVYPVYVDRADNSELWDVDGNQYIDFGTGIAVCNTGHNHPKVVGAIKKQLDKFSHTCVMVNPYESAVQLAEKLTKLAPGSSSKKAMFVTTGAEAVENCIKIARAHTGRRGVVAFTGGFHGRTHYAMGLTGKIAPYKNLFGPFPAEIFHVPFPIESYKLSVEHTMLTLEWLFKTDIAPQDVAAIIVEPVQGEGGFYIAPPELMQKLRELCDQHGILLIADEIQSGFARTGKMFAMDYSNVEPDLITMAKGIAGGVPIAAVVGKQEIMDAPLPGGLGGTYGGSPLGCAAALAVLDIIDEENLCKKAIEIGDFFSVKLNDLKSMFPQFIGEVRNLGAMIAIELVLEGDMRKPNVQLTQLLIKHAARHGLVLLACGFNGNVIRFLPALTMPIAIATEGLNRFESLFKQCVAELGES